MMDLIVGGLKDTLQCLFELERGKLFWRSCGREFLGWEGWGEGVRVTEGSRAHGGQVGCGFSELKGGGGAESARGMVEIGRVWV